MIVQLAKNKLQILSIESLYEDKGGFTKAGNIVYGKWVDKSITNLLHAN